MLYSPEIELSGAMSHSILGFRLIICEALVVAPDRLCCTCHQLRGIPRLFTILHSCYNRHTVYQRFQTRPPSLHHSNSGVCVESQYMVFPLATTSKSQHIPFWLCCCLGYPFISFPTINQSIYAQDRSVATSKWLTGGVPQTGGIRHYSPF